MMLINQSKQNTFKTFGRISRSKWHYRNDKQTFDPSKFWPKSKFSSSKTQAAIELYYSILKRNFFLALNFKHTYSNLTREEQQDLYNLKKDESIVINEADASSTVVTWDKKNYFMETEKHLSCKETQEDVSSDPSFHIKGIHDTLEKITKIISSNILDCFNVENYKLGRFYLLPKTHKTMYDILVRPVIFNRCFYTDNISAFLDHQLKPIATQVKSCMLMTFCNEKRETSQIYQETL